MSSQALLEKKLKAARDRMSETRSAFAALRAFNTTANRQGNPQLYNKLLPYGHFFHAVNQSLKAFTISNIVALADPASSASLFQICQQLIRGEPCGASKGELRRWLTDISKVQKRLKDYRHQFVSHVSHETDEFIDKFNKEGFGWDEMQGFLDDLGCKLEFLEAAATGAPIPTVDEVHREVFEFQDMSIDTREHTALFLQAVERYFPEAEKPP